MSSTRFVPFVLLLAACSTSLPHLEREGLERHDQPGEAAEYAAAKRAGSADERQSLRAAREAMRRLPHYSTEGDGWQGRPALQSDTLAAASARPFRPWTALGPGNIGGRTRALVIDPVTPDVIYAAGVSGGIWKTEDAGSSWRPIGDDLANIAVNVLAMDPHDTSTLYAGTGEGYFREEVRFTGLPLRGDGIFVTHDAGATWTQLASTAGPDFDWVNDLTVSPLEPSRLYAATRSGVWRSQDSGATWTQILSSAEHGGCLDLAARFDTGSDFLFASCGTLSGQATVYRNTQAETSAVFEPVLSLPYMGRTSLAIAPSNPSVVYAVAATNEPGFYQQGLHGVYCSTSGGAAGSWEARVTNDSPDLVSTLLLTNILTVRTACGQSGENVTMGWYCNTVAVDPVDPERVWIGAVDLFRSDDGGRTWGVASYWWDSQHTFVHADQHAIVFHPGYDGVTNRTVYFGNDGGVFRTADATAAVAYGVTGACDSRRSSLSFEALNHGYGVTQFYHGAVSPDGTWFMGGTQDNGTVWGSIADGPDAWRMLFGGDGTYVAIDPADPRFLYTQTQYGHVYRATGGTFSFRPVVSGLNDAFLFVTPMEIDRNAPSRLWLGGRRLWRTDDRAVNWSPVSTQLPAQVTAIAVAPGNSNRVLAGTTGGWIVRSDAATSATGSTAWTVTRPREGWVSWIAFDPLDPGVVYATYAGFGGDHLWRSLDGGWTWSPLGSASLPDLPVHSIAVDPTRRERLYLGTDLGVFVSLDGGSSWAVENTGFANAVTEAVVIGRGAYGPAVYAFTHGRGAWRAELTVAPGKRRAVRF